MNAPASPAPVGTVAVLGLGKLGMPAALNLLRAGFAVHGYRRGDMRALVEAGGVACASPRDAMAEADVAVEFLPSVEALESCVLGPDGIVHAMKPGRLLLNLGGYPPEVKRRIADALSAAGGAMIEGAVSGPPQAMAERRAALFLAGDREAVERARPVIDALTTQSHFLGAFGAALDMKLVANLLVAVHNAAAAEALAFGRRLGFDGATLLDVLRGSHAASNVFDYKAPLMVERRFTPAAGPFAALDKHVQWAFEAGERVGSPMPLLATALPYYRRAFELGRAHEDIAALIDLVDGARAPPAAA